MQFVRQPEAVGQAHGVVVKLHDASEDECHRLAALVARCAGKLVYLDCRSAVDPAALAGVARFAKLPPGSVLASGSAALLSSVSEVSTDAGLLFAYRLRHADELRQGPLCPHHAIELSFVNATSANIRRVHSFAKAVFVRVSKRDTESKEWHRRGAVWLERMGVDMLVYAG